MKRDRLIGLALLAVGAWVLLRGRGPGSLFMEFVWLAVLSWLALTAWRLLAGRPLSVRLAAHGVIAFVAVTTLGRLAGPTLLTFIGLAFFAVYRSRARGGSTAMLIPALVLFTVAATAGVDAVFPRWDQGVVFLLGMTATFTVVYLLPADRGGGRWALWPALVWGFITLAANDPGGGVARWIVPLLLIGAGVAALGWSRRKRG